MESDTLTGIPGARAFSEQLYRIREVHIEVEAILQSLAALQDDIPCARCTSVCCREVMCRESVDSDFLRFVLGPRVDDYGVNDGWYVPGSGCRLGYGRPLVCYEFFCEKFDAQGNLVQSGLLMQPIPASVQTAANDSIRAATLTP